MIDPSSGIDRAFDAAIWSDEDRSELKQHFLDLYRRGLEESGIGVTAAGLAEPPLHHNPNTRSLDKEIRSLRREVTVLAEALRSFFQIVVKLGACTADQLRDYLIEQSHRRLYEPPVAEDRTVPSASLLEAFRNGAAAVESAPAPTQDHAQAPALSSPAEPAVAEAGVTAEAAASAETIAGEEVSEAPVSSANGSVLSNGHAQGAGSQGAGSLGASGAAQNGHVPAADEAEADEFDSRPLAERLRRPMTRPSSTDPDPFQRLRQRPDAATKPRPSNVLPKPPLRMKQCGRCMRNVPVRAPRCLSCGYRF